jgi:hypothetical protein
MTTIQTPGGKVTIGRRYRLTVARDSNGSKELVGEVEAVEATTVGHCLTCKCQTELRYQVRTDNELIGIVPEHITIAETV